jgi:hypothetical protein
MTQWTQTLFWQQGAQRLLTMHATTCASNCSWFMWQRVFSKLRFRLVSERAETVAFMQNCLERNTLPSSGGDWEVFFRTLEEVVVKNEQRDVEGGVSELLMHESWSGTPAHPSTPLFPTGIGCGLLICTSNKMLCMFCFLKN